MADEADIATDHEDHRLALSLASHTNRPKERPEFNDDGDKICIECGLVIPKNRAEISFVVRCIECQELEDILWKNYSD